MSSSHSQGLIQRQVALKHLNTLAIESVADYFCEAVTLDDVHSARGFAQQQNIPLLVLGGGSNVVMPDSIHGLVLRFVDQHCHVLSETESTVTVEVGAGFGWHDFVMHSLQQGWFGLENLALIPGTVGAAPVQNIGAYGVEVERFIQTVQGVYLDSGETFSLSATECQFAYRESCFKQALDGKTLITSVTFELLKQPQVNVSYAPLNQMAEQQGRPTPMQLAQWVIQVRSEKLPDPAELPNAGSFFKNPVVSQSVFQALLERFEDLPSYPQGDLVKLPAGWLIDRLGFKGKCFADAVYVHKQQALVLVNQGGTGAQVIQAAQEIKQAVYDQYGIELEQEPRIFGSTS